MFFFLELTAFDKNKISPVAEDVVTNVIPTRNENPWFAATRNLLVNDPLVEDASRGTSHTIIQYVVIMTTIHRNENASFATRMRLYISMWYGTAGKAKRRWPKIVRLLWYNEDIHNDNILQLPTLTIIAAILKDIAKPIKYQFYSGRGSGDIVCGNTCHSNFGHGRTVSTITTMRSIYSDDCNLPACDPFDVWSARTRRRARTAAYKEYTRRGSIPGPSNVWHGPGRQ